MAIEYRYRDVLHSVNRLQGISSCITFVVNSLILLRIKCNVSLVMFEVLNGTLVCFCGFLGTERAKIAPSAGFGILLARVQAVLPGFEFPNHKPPRQGLMPGDGVGTMAFCLCCPKIGILFEVVL
jgi:hypothetical protein